MGPFPGNRSHAVSSLSVDDEEKKERRRSAPPNVDNVIQVSLLAACRVPAFQLS